MIRLLLTNDDGFDAPGLDSLRTAMSGWGEIWVVAPATPYSNGSHQVTTGRAIRVEKTEERYYVVEGSPADCVRIALTHLVPNADWVLSGINAGGNLGVDVFYSGTVAATREAALFGVRGFAFSHYLRRGLTPDWQKAGERAARVWADLHQRPLSSSSFWNVNLPHLDADHPEPDWAECALDPAHLPIAFELIDGHARYNGEYHTRPRRPGSDVDVCFSGGIAVTRIDVPVTLGDRAFLNPENNLNT